MGTWFRISETELKVINIEMHEVTLPSWTPSALHRHTVLPQVFSSRSVMKEM